MSDVDFIDMDDFILEEEDPAELVDDVTQDAPEEEEEKNEEEEEEEEEKKEDEEEEELEGIVLDEETLVPHLGILDSPNNLEYSYTKLLLNESEVRDAKILADYPHLRFISLASNNLRFVPWLAAMESAVYVDLHGNQIKILPEFEKEIPNLITFNLQGNKIRNIPVLPFPILTKIDMSENMVKMIAPAAFEKIAQLRTIKLSQNKIRRITSDTFKGLKNLRRLYLDNNQIKFVADDAWHELESLRKLDLSENRIRNLKSFAEVRPNLAVLLLAGNQIKKLTDVETTFKEYKELRELTTTGNPLNDEEEYRLRLIYALPQLKKIDDEEEITAEDREQAEQYIADKKAEEEEQKRLEEEARRAEEEEEEAERRRRLAEEEEEEEKKEDEDDEKKDQDDDENGENEDEEEDL